MRLWWQRGRAAPAPLEAKYLPKPTETWSNLETVERTKVKKGVLKQVEMIALETYDRDREPDTPTVAPQSTQAQSRPGL